MDSKILNKDFFQFLRLSGLFHFFGKSFLQVLKTTIYVSRRSFSGLLYSFEKNSSGSFSEPERKTVGLSEKLIRMVVKMHSTSPEDDFAESV